MKGQRLYSFFLVCLLAAAGGVALLPSLSSALGYSLRFYGHGRDDVDRVKVKLDAPAVPADVGRSFTVEFWLKASLSDNPSPSCSPGGSNWIFGNVIVDRDVYGDGDRGDYGISLANGRIAFGVSRGTEAQTICGSVLVADDQWHHVAVTRDARTGRMAIFVDGSLDASDIGPRGNIGYRNRRSTAYPNSDPYLVFGAEKHDAGPSSPSLSGFLDEVRISKKVRYTTNFSPPTAPFEADRSTVALYRFDEGPAGPCTGLIVDSARRGRSPGVCRFGGSPPGGPEYSTDVPPAFPTSTPTPTTTPTATPGGNSEWSQHAGNAQRTSFQPVAIPTPWRWKWAWNGPDAAGKVRPGKFGLPRNSQPITGGGRVYVAAGSRGVYALDATTGSELWNARPGGSFNSTPAFDSETDSVFALSSSGIVYKLAAASGAVLGNFPTGASSPLPLPPALAGSRLFVSMGTKVFCLDPHSLTSLWTYEADSPVDTPPAYSATRDLVVVASRDLFVHGIRAASGARQWRVKTTVRSPGDPGGSSNFAEVSNGWPVIAEQHGLVLVKLRLDWQALWTISPWPATNAEMRAALAARPDQQALLALRLEDGSTAFVANVGHGGFGDGDYLPMGPMPVIARLPGDQEVAYVVMRGSPCLESPCDGRWDSRFGEMLLDDATVPSFAAGDVRFMENTFFPTDEQAYISMAGNQMFGAHWEAGIAHEIVDRSPTRGGSAANPITTVNLPHIVTSQDSNPCGPFRASHYCADGLVNTRSWPGGFYIYWKEGAVYDQYWSEYAGWVISGDTLYFVSTDGAVVALEHGSPVARSSVSVPERDDDQGIVLSVAHGVYPHTEARGLAGTIATIEGELQEVFNNGKAVYLGFQKPHRGAFLVRILRQHWDSFPNAPEKTYRVGDRVRVTGKIEWYQGDPVMYVRSPAQIERMPAKDLEAAALSSVASGG